MTPVLRASGIAVSYGGRPVLRGVDLSVDPGHRTGLVGENGVGKSTLLRVLAGAHRPDEGTVSRPPGLGFLHQELDHPTSATVERVVADALADVRALERELETAAAALADGSAPQHEGPGPQPAEEARADRYGAALARAEAADVWDADARAARTLAGLGLDPQALAGRTVGTLSGGQRTRLGLAALLIRRPGALLLDEPTNHLDDDAAEYLAAALRALPGAVVLASHDRVFLDEVCTEILDLDPTAEPARAGTSAGWAATPYTTYGGTYGDYLEAKRVERARWEQRFATEQDELTRLRRSVAVTARDVAKDRERGNQAKILYDMSGERVQSQVARRVRNAQQRLDDLERDQVGRPPAPLRFAPPPGRSTHGEGELVAWASDVVVHRGAPAQAGERPERLDLAASGAASIEIARGTRLLVTGANGAGKSTLLHVLAGDLAPDAGVAGRARGVRVGLLEQDVHLSDDARTPRELLALAQGVDPQDARDAQVDAHGLVAPRDLGRPLGDLSVGQRRRVVVAMLVVQAPDVLLLDEPTNHVSLTLADELMDAVADWPGAVVVASHDRWLRRRWKGATTHLA
ncbi:ABC-F family ATP-binding cassette domain-containing protein [Cellulosimicrobium arenosum]|uniref:ABC-F family ATP-binding cassette domain-containing protein n=1 Tax=Cellulosimicrobium arenosum TaxID=2708133 RepID=A0A927G7U7_9MICO|nr:ABC-F family ATP-binding cassette domain-containing protein [Cellulosimicrobium arenosum]MBD8078526.1 ABC-F family ATP-binding cassette domain-containing protein [Cellulosimicrobium arenosum]